MYERAKTGELFPVQDPNLHLDALEQVQEQVAALFEKGLPTNEHQLQPQQEATETDRPTSQIDQQSEQEEGHIPPLLNEFEATDQPESDQEEPTGKFN